MTFVSTGSLPRPEAVQAALDGADTRYRPLTEGQVYASASATNARNRELARLPGLPDTAAGRYTRQCSLRVSAHDVAVMGATLADGGVNLVTGERAIAAEVWHYPLAVMVTAGPYEPSGDWLYDAGPPAKSGIVTVSPGNGPPAKSGIVTVSPGKGGMGTFAPARDAAGTSVKGQRVARFLSAGLGMDLLIC